MASDGAGRDPPPEFASVTSTESCLLMSDRRRFWQLECRLGVSLHAFWDSGGFGNKTAIGLFVEER